MPHVIVKMISGRSEDQKARLTVAITEAVKSALASNDDSISVAVEDYAQADWTEQVYKPDILGKASTLYKKPGYEPT